MRFSMVLHAHQPPGNFDHAFQHAVDVCYRPFFEVLERFPGIRVSLHCSGSLLEWLESHQPDLVEMMARLVQQRQVEVVSAGLYEPILALLPKHDRVNQLLAHRAYMRQLFGVIPTVGWLTERVWSQPIAEDLAGGGIEAIPLDDLHFLSAGLDASELNRPYVTEYLGHTLTVVPAPKEMRDALPWEPVDRAIGAIRRHAGAGDPLLVYADDLEKWGLWPGTYRTVYERGWLTRFFERLERLGASKAPVDVVPLGEALEDVRAAERVYLPDGSYAEMMQWTLPPRAQRREAALRGRLREAALWDEAMPFTRAGTYYQFLAKYPEINHLHKRMLEVSARVAARHAPREVARDIASTGTIPDAVRALWRGQANCAYWHGMFGGTYLPFLRQSLFRNLLIAERQLQAAGEPRRGMRVGDLDARRAQSVVATTETLTVAVSPQDGGGIVELSDRGLGYNLADTLARRAEAYHSADNPPYPYDPGRRAMFIERFLAPGRPPARSQPIEDRGEFAALPFSMQARRSGGATVITLEREAGAADGVARVVKRFRLDDGTPRLVHTTYDVIGVEGTVDARFGVEVNVAVLFASAQSGVAPIDLDRATGVGGATRLELTGYDPALGMTLTASAPGDLDVRPITTVSQSEAGVESIRQSNACLFTWPIRLEPGERFSVEFTLEVIAHAAEAQS